jgi:hypothetical protein
VEENVHFVVIHMEYVQKSLGVLGKCMICTLRMKDGHPSSNCDERTMQARSFWEQDGKFRPIARWVRTSGNRAGDGLEETISATHSLSDSGRLSKAQPSAVDRHMMAVSPLKVSQLCPRIPLPRSRERYMVQVLLGEIAHRDTARGAVQLFR